MSAGRQQSPLCSGRLPVRASYIYDLAQTQMEPAAQYDVGDASVHMNTLAFGDGSPVVMAGTSTGSVAAFTIHGLTSANSGPILGDPKQQLESILMMGRESVT